MFFFFPSFLAQVTTYDGVLGTSYPKVDTPKNVEYVVQPQRKIKLKVFFFLKKIFNFVCLIL